MLNHCLSSLFCFLLFGCELRAAEIEPRERVVISHQDLYLFLKNDFSYNLPEDFIYEVSPNRIRKKIGAIFDSLLENTMNTPIEGTLLQYLKEIGIKQNRSFIDDNQLLNAYNLLPAQEKKIERIGANSFDIIYAIESVIKSYFDESFLSLRKMSRDEFLRDEPYIAIILTLEDDNLVSVLGAPGACQQTLFPADIDYELLHPPTTKNNLLGYVSIYLLLATNFISMAPTKFPSITNYWSEQYEATRAYQDKLSELGLETGASSEEIKTRCQALRLQFHPDKNHEEGALEYFLRIQDNCNSLK